MEKATLPPAQDSEHDRIPRGRGSVRVAAGLGRNFAAMLAWQVGNYLVPLATFPYLTRILGPSQFGVVSYVIAITVYGTVCTEWGFNLSGPRMVSKCRQDRARLNELIWSIIGAKASLCVISSTALFAVVRFDHHIQELGAAVWIGWLSVLANVFTLNWLLQGLERFSLFATIALVGRFATLPLTFCVVTSPIDVNAAVAVQSAASLIVAVGSMSVAYQQGLLAAPLFSWRTIRTQLVESTDMFISAASVSLFSATNAVILGGISGPYQVGLYAAADKLKTVGNMVPAQINTVLYPRVAAFFSQQTVEGVRMAAMLTAVGLLATAATTCIGLIVCLSLSDVLTRIALGQNFVGAAPIVDLLCLSTIFGNLAYFLGLQVLVPFNGSARRARAMLGAGGFNILLAFLLAPRFGAYGAAVAYLAAEVALLGVYVMWIVRSTEMRAHFMQLKTS
ncbi:PST family polysaccharide transporter [Paraburkholderia sp. BL27I4N3]|uniref:flippase n=1 Tax=Paraburkholderia sp. BL27I4N3 TaxID=1938805 RepID=UPI000E223B7F|nr:flippase [Paraburkholderia sp. BL27I4N3]REE22810.1 PST family polysaccharide transporter [Paraburkholderia sp. BL27I4N3]